MVWKTSEKRMKQTKHNGKPLQQNRIRRQISELEYEIPPHPC
jgi:hypothetical protein